MVTWLWHVQVIVWKKYNQREVTQKVRKGEQSVLHPAHRLDLIHIAMKFHSYIPYGYRIMMHTRIVCKILIRGQ